MEQNGKRWLAGIGASISLLPAATVWIALFCHKFPTITFCPSVDKCDKTLDGGGLNTCIYSPQIERPKCGYHQCSTWGSLLAQGVSIEITYRSGNNSSIVVSPKFTPVWVTAHKSGEPGAH